MPTTNPVPSLDPSDLLFNAAKLDEVVNSEAETYTDRIGVVRKTLKWMETASTGITAVQAALDAEAAQAAAEAARDAAMLSAGVYATTAAGLAATTSGEYFNVPAGDIAISLILYLNSAGTAVEQKRYPSLEALNNLQSGSIRDSTNKRILIPAGGTFSGGASDTTGAIKIKLPIGSPPTNIVIGVTVMDNYGVMRLRIGGFNNVGSWNYTVATIESDHQFQPQPSIRWGNDGTGDCIWIGDLAVNFWAYPQVWITDVVVNSGGSGWAGSGWAVSLVTAFDTVTAGPVLPVKPIPNVNPTFTGTLNGGVVNFPSGGGSTVSTYLGYQAGINSVGVGQYNTFVGYQCGYANTTGYNNTFGGLQTGAACTTGYANSGWGLQTLQYLTTGSFNAAYSIHALLSLTTGQSNNAFGAGAMEYLTTGSSNNAFGMYAGRDTQGSGNLFLGHHAGITANSSNELWISNSETQNLIRGHFVNNRLWVAGGDDDGANEFQVNGSLRFKPKAISTPVNNGDLTFEATGDTQLKIKLKGSDGVVRSVTLALS